MAKKPSYEWQYTEAGLVIRERAMKELALFFMICFGGGVLLHLIPMLFRLLIRIFNMLIYIPIGIFPSYYQYSALGHDLLGMLFALPFLAIGVWGLWLYMRKHTYTFERDKRQLVHQTYSFRQTKSRRVNFDDITTVTLDKNRGSTDRPSYYYTVGLTSSQGDLFTLELTGDYPLALSRAQDLQRILRDPIHPHLPTLVACDR